MAYGEDEYGTAAPLEVGDILASTFRTIGARPATYFGLVAAFTIPSNAIGFVIQVVQHYVTRDLAASPGDPAAAMTAVGFMLASLAFGLVAFAVGVLMQTALLRIVVEHVQGRELEARDALRAALPRYFSVLGASLIFVLATTVGSMMCIVPGVLAYVWLIAATPAAANEELGPIQALQRSIDLTEGNRMTIFLTALVVNGAIMTLFCCVLSPTMAATWTAAIEQREAAVDPLAPAQLVSQALMLVLNIGMVVVVTTLTGVIYAKLRGLRDQVDAGAVAKVFA